MQSVKRKIWQAVFLVIPLLCAGNIFAAVTMDDYTPEVTTPVARISFLRGEAQIRRADAEDWERATGNLPIVEGDEITTDGGARLEIQFDSRTFLRLSENSYLKIVALKDEGIAVSLPQGSLSARILQFDLDKKYFEIDAPQTTVAVQKAGMYRVDAGDKQKAEVRIAVTEAGEARIYSESSGFTLRSGRTARVYLEGNFAGEWETGDALAVADNFDQWSLDRDAIIAKRLKDAYYDKYYDRDIYGAEDLNEYGEWIYTRKYGYVWRPFRNSVAAYADWSPYRYGHWRWIPPYGWTWVNDEPWGWATYHHGRWVYDDGYWVWTPYGQFRYRRSWWSPALTVVTWNGSLICWYPLPYEAHNYNYNRHYSSRRRNTTIVNNNTTVIVNNPPVVTNPNQPNVVTAAPNLTNEQRAARLQTPPLGRVPQSGVIAVDASEFGRRTGGFRVAPPDTARTVLAKTPETIDSSPLLPTLTDLNGRVSREIAVAAPPVARTQTRVRIGAGERESGGSLDGKLRQQRIYGNRPPVVANPAQTTETPAENSDVRENRRARRPTGAVERTETNNGGGDAAETNRKQRAPYQPPLDQPNGVEEQKPAERDREKPARQRRDDPNVNQMPPIYEAPRERPKERSKPREETPREEPRYEAPKPPREESRPDPPRREERRSDPPPAKREEPRQESPKQKSEPPPADDSKPAPSRGKNGRDGN